MEWNILALFILLALFALWNLDLIATLLNLKALSPTLPSEFADTFDADRYARSQAYTRESSRFELIHASFSLSALLAFWTVGGFGWLDQFARKLAPGEILPGLVFLGLLFVGNTLLQLPFAIYDTFVIEQKFGFNKTTARTFAIDQFKGLLLAALLGLPLVAGILWIFSHVAHAWLWAWGFFVSFQLFLTWLAPTLILPLFNKFTPMADGPLRQAIESMAAKCGFPLGEISVMDGSKRSTKANAFFTGFGKTKKIALYDTLVEEQGTDELVAVLAHEIGHFKLRHIVQRLAVSILQAAALFYLLGSTIDGGPFSRDLFDAFGVATISPHVGLVLFGILFSPISRLLGIAAAAWSRKHEFEADAFAAQATGHPESLVSALKKLSAKNLSNLTPHPFRVFLDHSHPPTLARIAALRERSAQ
ncbi:MAG: M48 family peptidase [Verrucomicrobia bacterium]|nr:MAG: M48 family peptidase [Verrucomicrobiota bacterium]TAE89110.1 MAG: M48 family peptidase [Verrucomicrobiota bacterium]TAF28017.1 MAG: M48 family peptidase [Verrucomicrobiota bacterium]TAF42864.1 MAG: M48 family peptidase [Verrucomicrobiota bacterium]